MQTKLTLRIDDQLIKQAKDYARLSDKSLSQLVAEYFALLQTESPPEQELTPSVKSLKGILKDPRMNIDDYQQYREDKYR